MAKETVLKTVIKNDLTIYNVPFIQSDSQLNDFRLTGKVIFKLADLVEYMKNNEIYEYDYQIFAI